MVPPCCPAHEGDVKPRHRSCNLPHLRIVSILVQTGESWSSNVPYMAITIHRPDHSPAPTESPFPGYPIGVRPRITSAVCADLSPDNLRHHECSLPACTCPCH